MKIFPPSRLCSFPVVTLLICVLVPNIPAEPAPVRQLQGTVHGFLELYSQDGQVLAAGDLVQVARGDQLTVRLTFHFKDGSIDDETTVLSQRRAFRLISDHHIQKGPSFPHPMDMAIDCRSNQVTIRTTGKDGKEDVKTSHLNLPPDLANGMVAIVLENTPPGAAEITMPMLVATPKPRLVKLLVSSRGQEDFSVSGSSQHALHEEIKIDLGGVAAVVAPVIGKQPPNIQVWLTTGQGPTLIREQAPLYPEGPVVTIQLAGTVWPDPAKSGN